MRPQLASKAWIENNDTVPTITDAESVTDGAIYSTACAAYVIIKEEPLDTTTTLCAGQNHGSHIYMSTSNKVEISFVQTKLDDKTYFLIKYEGISLGHTF